jgi:hypothetical protein
MRRKGEYWPLVSGSVRILNVLPYMWIKSTEVVCLK